MGIKGSYHVRACWNLRWKGVSVEAEVANPEFCAEIDLYKSGDFVCSNRHWFTWHIGLRTALQVCLAQVTGSYWIGGRSGLSWREYSKGLSRKQNSQPWVEYRVLPRARPSWWPPALRRATHSMKAALHLYPPGSGCSPGKSEPQTSLTATTSL